MPISEKIKKEKESRLEQQWIKALKKSAGDHVEDWHKAEVWKAIGRKSETNHISLSISPKNTKN